MIKQLINLFCMWLLLRFKKRMNSSSDWRLLRRRRYLYRVMSQDGRDSSPYFFFIFCYDSHIFFFFPFLFRRPSIKKIKSSSYFSFLNVYL